MYIENQTETRCTDCKFGGNVYDSDDIYVVLYV